jgi:radical SAM protein with 4Fe4S-binding SPASM domain
MKYIKINPTYIEVITSDHIQRWQATRPKKYWEYRKKWHENPKRQIVGKFPLHLDIESTRRCNLRCPMCVRTIKLKRGEKIEEGDMDFNLFKKIVSEGAVNGLYSIKLNYLGEPLICKDLVKMVAYAKNKGIIDVMFNTNGSLLTKAVARELIKAGLDKLFISFDSPFKERYEKIRVGTKFEKVIENVKNLIQIRNKLKSPTPIVRVSMVVMKENKREVLDYIKLWKPIVDLVGFSDYLNPQGMDKRKRYAIKLRRHENFVCSQLYQRLFIHYNGKIGLCCVDYDAECDLGNVKDTFIKDVWLGEKMRKIRELHNKGKWYENPLCKKCHMPYI